MNKCYPYMNIAITMNTTFIAIRQIAVWLSCQHLYSDIHLQTMVTNTTVSPSTMTSDI